MLKKGALVLSAWCWLNVLPAVASLLFIAQGKHAPGLKMLFTSEEVSGIENRALAMVDGLAVLLNTLIAVYCVSCFFVVRMAILKCQRWAFFVFVIGALILQAVCYLSDRSFFLGKNTLVIHLSSLLLLIGFGLCGIEIFKKKPNQYLRPTEQAK
jgi:hypothetical protein